MKLFSGIGQQRVRDTHSWKKEDMRTCLTLTLQPGPAAGDAFPPQHKEENQAVGSPGKAPRQESEAGDAEGQTPEMQG